MSEIRPDSVDEMENKIETNKNALGGLSDERMKDMDSGIPPPQTKRAFKEVLMGANFSPPSDAFEKMNIHDAQQQLGSAPTSLPEFSLGGPIDSSQLLPEAGETLHQTSQGELHQTQQHQNRRNANYSNQHNGGGGYRGNRNSHSSGSNEVWSSSKPKPKVGYKCKICGQPGGEPDSHWFQLCPKGQQQQQQQQQIPGNKNFQPPKKGYYCKLCGKQGGEPDSHWFQQCPCPTPMSSPYVKGGMTTPGLPGSLILPTPYGDYSVMYHPQQLLYFHALQQMASAQSGVQGGNSQTGPVVPMSPSLGPVQPGTPTMAPAPSPYNFPGQPFILTNSPGHGNGQTNGIQAQFLQQMQQAQQIQHHFHLMHPQGGAQDQDQLLQEMHDSSPR